MRSPAEEGNSPDHAGGPIGGRWNLETSFKLGHCE
jgi:hypothetical protein